MIRIKKPAEPPGVLRRRGIPATHELCERMDADPAAHESFEFDSGIYSHSEVKTALRKAQHDKCAFCESKVTHVSPGDVEHFRPKAGYRQKPRDPLVRPGYYWLAYEWSNLLFACPLCNQRFKKNHFPLANPARRARSHRDDVGREKPQLIHPVIEEPTEFLEFREHFLHAIGGNPRGRATIRILGLNRVEIAERRLDALNKLRALVTAREAFRAVKRPGRDVEEAIRSINDQIGQWIEDTAEYAAMIRAALRVWTG